MQKWQQLSATRPVISVNVAQRHAVLGNNVKTFKCGSNYAGDSVQRPSAAGGAAVARDFVVLERELVVVCNFLVDVDVSSRVDDDLLLRFNGDDLCTAVWLKNAATQ